MELPNPTKEIMTLLAWIGGGLTTLWGLVVGFLKWRASEKKTELESIRNEARQLLDDYREERNTANQRMADMQERFDREIKECRDECAAHMDKFTKANSDNIRLSMTVENLRNRVRDLEHALGYRDSDRN